DVELVRRMIERGPNAPWTSSVGRLFDAVASILGLRDVAGYEGQAAAELEGAAAESEPAGAYPIEVFEEGGCWVGRPAPLVRALAADVRRGVDRARAARRFHAGLVEMIREICARLRAEFGLDRVVFSGGVFMNARLGLDAERALARDGFRVYQHEAVPPNDGGLCLGQLAVAAAGEA
ncbi:MAG TPA: carbamoyltransferase HypF, partial [Planctomycetota bacterium]|nr:carbamoyltransferase HypF [Planctomycetota bacterium]